MPSGSPSSSLVTPTLAALADPPNRNIDGAVMDYFLIEAVNALRASSAVATARARKIEKEMVDAGLLPPPAPTPAPPVKKETPRDSLTSLGSRSGSVSGGAGKAMDEEEEAVRVRLEAIGIHVGANYTER